MTPTALIRLHRKHPDTSNTKSEYGFLVVHSYWFSDSITTSSQWLRFDSGRYDQRASVQTLLYFERIDLDFRASAIQIKVNASSIASALLGLAMFNWTSLNTPDRFSLFVFDLSRAGDELINDFVDCTCVKNSDFLRSGWFVYTNYERLIFSSKFGAPNPAVFFTASTWSSDALMGFYFDGTFLDHGDWIAGSSSPDLILIPVLITAVA